MPFVREAPRPPDLVVRAFAPAGVQVAKRAALYAGTGSERQRLERALWFAGTWAQQERQPHLGSEIAQRLRAEIAALGD